MLIVLLALYAGALLGPPLFRRFGHHAFYFLSIVPAASFVWVLFTLPQYLGAKVPEIVIPWVPSIGLAFDFRMDALSALMSLVVLGVGALVLVYCAHYFHKGDPNLGAFGGQLAAFAASMFGLVTANNLLLLFIFWELTTILSYLLISYSRAKLAARNAALQALMVTTAGGLAMLVGIVMLGETAGTYKIDELVAKGPELVRYGPAVGVAVVLILVGAISKSALFPLHFWLPGAMAAPTPVSAYLHAAAMVKAGIYLIARFAPGYCALPAWQVTLMTLGLATMLIGGWRSLRQYDLKLILAYGTVSQLGFMVMVVGLGGQYAALAGLTLLVAHALFKATLFLVVGIIDHQAGTRDIRELAGLYQSMPKVTWIAGIAAASMAGIPPLLGFVAKEAVYEAFWEHALAKGTAPFGWVLLVGVVLGSIFTFAYSARFMWGGFSGKRQDCVRVVRPVSLGFLVSPLILTAGTVGLGLFPQVLNPVFDPYVRLFPLPAHGHTPHLALWHGFTPALALSAVTLLGGIAMFLGRRGVWAVQTVVGPHFSASSVYTRIVIELDRLARWVTGHTQRGSLTVYLFVILSTMLVTNVVVVIVNKATFHGSFYAFDTPVQVLVGASILVGAIFGILAKKRFIAVVLISVTGYGVAVIFAIQGAPDLALTQTLVETVALVAFVLALRFLPAKLWMTQAGRYPKRRLVISVLVGLMMMAVAAIAMGGRVFEPVSLHWPELAYTLGGGKNIVNVALVDIRGWDTFGEISVLALAATGVASLIFVRSRGDRRIRAANVEPGTIGRDSHTTVSGQEKAQLRLARQFYVAQRNPWLVAGPTLAPERRSIVIEVITRLVFHSIIMVSLFLLLTGHNTPGGGFAGGLMAGLALTLRYLAGGRIELAEATPASAGTLLGLGLGLAALSAIVPVALGGYVLQQAIFTFHDVWIFGTIKFATSTVFDLGVYLVVVGLVLDVVRSFGSHLDYDAETAAPTPGGSTAQPVSSAAKPVAGAGAAAGAQRGAVKTQTRKSAQGVGTAQSGQHAGSGAGAQAVTGP